MASPEHDPTHPIWCREHIEADDDTVIHLGENHHTSGAYVRVERRDGDPAMVRVETNGEPIPPLDALRLARVVEATAVQALQPVRSTWA